MASQTAEDAQAVYEEIVASNRNSQLRVAALMLVFLLPIAAVLLSNAVNKVSKSSYSSGSYKTSPLLLEPSNASKAERVIDEWLQSQRQGDSGVEFWDSLSTPSTLFAVSSWELVKPATDGYATHANVIIESSNRLGTPIRKTWKISVRHTANGPRISAIEDLSAE